MILCLGKQRFAKPKRGDRLAYAWLTVQVTARYRAMNAGAGDAPASVLKCVWTVCRQRPKSVLAHAAGLLVTRALFVIACAYVPGGTVGVLGSPSQVEVVEYIQCTGQKWERPRWFN